MTLQLVGLAAAWLASAYRLWISFRQPATIWRTSFTVGIVCAALGVTFQSYTPQIDSWTAPSVGSLLNHLIVIAGLVIRHPCRGGPFRAENGGSGRPSTSSLLGSCQAVG